MSRSLFVYWTVDPAALPAAVARTRAAQASLQRQSPGLEARLWMRDEGAPTVMETYMAPAGIDVDTEARIEAALAHALAGLPVGPRHVEAFRPA